MTTDVPAILITGGAQGIGKGLVHHFAARGYAVVFVDRDEDAGRETAEAIPGSVYVDGDVTVDTLPPRAVATCLSRFGRLDALINNAGVSEFTPIDTLSLPAFRRVLEINLVSYFAFAKAAAAALRESRGAMVNIASTRAIMSEPDGEAYAASKGGIVALTHALAISLGPQVRVNAISPGWIDVGPWQKSAQRRAPETEPKDHALHPVGRIGTVEDIAHLAEFLISTRSGFITGQNYVVDGGMTKKMIY
jgi:NAD(P)-dependent dehydrogenase (short-subunit alcohol dehydrogenase family)